MIKYTVWGKQIALALQIEPISRATLSIDKNLSIDTVIYMQVINERKYRSLSVSTFVQFKHTLKTLV